MAEEDLLRVDRRCTSYVDTSTRDRSRPHIENAGL